MPSSNASSKIDQTPRLLFLLVLTILPWISSVRTPAKSLSLKTSPATKDALLEQFSLSHSERGHRSLYGHPPDLASIAKTSSAEASTASSAEVSLKTIRSQIRTNFDRFLSLNGGKSQFSAEDCIQTSLTCGSTCGFQREHRTLVCVCFRIQGKHVTYLEKEPGVREDDYGYEWKNSWSQDIFHSLMMTLNKLQIAVLQSEDLYFDPPLYFVANVYDYPRLFTNLDQSYPLKFKDTHKDENTTDAVPSSRYHWHRQITPQHHSENLHFDFFPTQGFEGGFPNNEIFRPTFRCGTPKDHFPIFSWSINPKLNFDILAPHSHPQDCIDEIHKQTLVNVPWANKTKSLVFRGAGPHRFDGECNSTHSGHMHRGRLCGKVHDPEMQEYALHHNLTIDMFGPHELKATEQAYSKFLILVDGAVAAFRSTWYPATGSCVLIAAAFEDVRSQFFIPYVHYIPVKPDFSDLFMQLDMVLLNDEYAEWVGNNAYQLSRRLSLDHNGINDGGFSFDLLYWQELLQAYSQRFSVDDAGVDLSNFTDARQCHTIKESEHCFDGNDFACHDILQVGMKPSVTLQKINSTEWRPQVQHQ